ncbi:hypothetical protein [Actinoallomurus rhizosphaericola]|uniref:hypothetical protein n=1 Tax=Actinoallomurus rhizosphaericola TaxID=2952536 RepID=UPI002093B5D1|nr:hypothetical protein [Actinoallomurus rhizosphaericola]MCO6000153.1 hypothetical protein [Actinoallomurus rhizosphaericola]
MPENAEPRRPHHRHQALDCGTVEKRVSGAFQGLVAEAVPGNIEDVARAAGQGTLRLPPIARPVPLAKAIEALTELERFYTPEGGQLVITTE